MSPRGTRDELASFAQLARLNELALLPRALEGGDRVTRETAWVLLEEAVAQGLWKPKRERGTKPAWAPPTAEQA